MSISRPSVQWRMHGSCLMSTVTCERAVSTPVFDAERLHALACNRESRLQLGRQLPPRHFDNSSLCELEATISPELEITLPVHSLLYSELRWNQALRIIIHRVREKNVHLRGVVGRGRGRRRPPLFFDKGDASPPPTFLNEIRTKVSPLLQLVTYWNAVKDNFSTAELISIFYRHSNTSSCIAEQDQRSAVAIFLTCMSVRVCRPKLFKNLCLSLVSGVPHFFLGLQLGRPRIYYTLTEKN